MAHDSVVTLGEDTLHDCCCGLKTELLKSVKSYEEGGLEMAIQH